MNWLQIRLFGPYFSPFSTNSYGDYSQKSQYLFSNGQVFAPAQIVRQAASRFAFGLYAGQGYQFFHRVLSWPGRLFDTLVKKPVADKLRITPSNPSPKKESRFLSFTSKQIQECNHC